MFDAGIVIGTFGHEDWNMIGTVLMHETEEKFPEAKVVHVHHESSLGAARNEGASLVDSEWLIFLDADDRLGDGYVEAMSTGKRLLRQPATRGFYPDGTKDDEAVIIPERNFRRSNHLVIGTACSHALFDHVGGFDEELQALEDWDLWLRMWLEGAEWEPIPEAVYWVHVTDSSRNTQTAVHHDAYRKILKKYDKSMRKVRT